MKSTTTTINQLDENADPISKCYEVLAIAGKSMLK
jgi:hypothetical protein